MTGPSFQQTSHSIPISWKSLKSYHGIKFVLNIVDALYAAGVATSQSSPGIHEAGLALQGVCVCLEAT